jgi:hypothetical protein
MVFYIRQLQEKCHKQKRPLYLTFIDVTKAFNMGTRTGLYTLLPRIGCPPNLLKMIMSFHDAMMGTLQYDGSSADSFPIKSSVKQGCVLAHTLFGIFFSLLLRYAFHESDDGIFLHTRSNGNLFKLLHLRAKTRVHRVLIREIRFADDAVIAMHSEESLQRLISRFADACRVLPHHQPDENQHHGPTCRHHPSFPRDACVGLVMCGERKTVTSQRTSSKASSPPVHVPPDDLPCASRTCARET